MILIQVWDEVIHIKKFKEDLVKNFILSLSVYFFASFLILNLPSCQQKERIIEKQIIQIEDEELQEKDTAIYKTRKYKGKDNKEREYKYLSLDFSRFEKPGSLESFTHYFHLPPISQGHTGTCWCFAAISFFESELKRLGKPEAKLSEMYIVYWEFVEKARRFIKEKGSSYFAHGSECNAVIRQMRKHGIVRESDYSGLLESQTEHNHRDLFKEMNDFLQFCKENEYWDEEKAVDYIKIILNKHMGRPPETIEANGRKMTPGEYLKNVLELPLDNYAVFMSFKYVPFYTKGEFKVPDNWWNNKDYYNVPLEGFYNGVVSALKKGYTVAIGGDTSEPGNSRDSLIAIIPSFDIPQKLIDQDSREFRFKNRTTTDDHAVHIVGYKEMSDHTWFLIKDSLGGGKEGELKGLYFMRDDYVRLKMLVFMVHKEAVSDLLEKITENTEKTK